MNAQSYYAQDCELDTGSYRAWTVEQLNAFTRLANDERGEICATPVSGDMLAVYRAASPRTIARRRVLIRANAEDPA